MGIFDDIDFNSLLANFKEDSVREEIITPLLKCLGYSTFDSSKLIVRSPHLEHPFIQFGTKSNKVTIIPDYLIKVNNKNAFIIDAKSPSENIIKGKNVEQAYSYAIHRDVQVKIFVLCNGKEISVFNINNREPIIHLFLSNITEQDASNLYECLTPQAFINPNMFNFKLDYGIWCIQNKVAPNVLQYFNNCYISDVSKLDDKTFVFNTVIKREEELLATFEFDISLFEDFMMQVPEHLKDKVRNYTRRNPFSYIADKAEDSFPLTFTAYLSDFAVQNNNEDYLPLIIKNFYK